MLFNKPLFFSMYLIIFYNQLGPIQEYIQLRISVLHIFFSLCWESKKGKKDQFFKLMIL